MIGYLCATPFHITAAVTMQSGMFSKEKATLIILNHFNVDEQLLKRIRSTGVFDEVVLFNNCYKTKIDNIKRLANAFIPATTMRKIANKTEFSRFICFALDFIDLTYIMKRYEKRGINCEFAFGDDGIGTYIREGIYKPKVISQKLLKLNGRLSFVDRVRTVYVYKPEYMVANLSYDLRPIDQNPEACRLRREAVSTIWPLEEDVNIDGGILYLEQPNENDQNCDDQKIEQAALKSAVDLFNAHSVVKMHPRSTAEDAWRPFGLIKTKMPYEVMLLQKQCAPLMMMTVSSTALFSAYLFDDLPAADCPSVLLYKLMIHQEGSLSESLNKLCRFINESQAQKRIFNPENDQQLQQLLQELNRR